MSTEQQTSPSQENAYDPSLSGAIDAMPDIEALEDQRGVSLAPASKREPDGKFAPKADEAPDKDAKEPAKPEAKTAEAAAPPADEEEDYIELPPVKDGEQPARHKLSEIIEGWGRTKEVEAQLAQAARPMMPQEIEAQLEQNVAARHNLIAVMKDLQRATAPPAPDMDLVNVHSPRYNPEEYHRQGQAYVQHQQEQHALRAASAQAQYEQAEQHKVLAEARYQREWARTVELWPEVKDKAATAKFIDEVTKTFPYTKEQVQAIESADVLLTLRDALNWRKAQVAKEAAVKVVKAKPKLVRGSARENQTGKQAQYAAASQRLGSSHSLDDAADAIGALLG